MLVRSLSVVLTLLTAPIHSWMTSTRPLRAAISHPGAVWKTVVFSSSDDSNDEDKVDRTSFDQAGKSLIEEEDRQRMELMGDFDTNPEYQSDSIERMRAAIRARTADLGIEKSKVSADYIRNRQEKAIQAGPGNTDADTFAGVDLSKISSTPKKSSEWNEEMPSMFYDPEDEMSKEEQEEVDPVMKLSILDQGLNEYNNAKWPDWGSALREVGVLLAVVALSALLIIGWDKLLRVIYTSVGFIPTKEEIANYASRFDGLDLPKGWTNNMSEQDVASFSDTVNQATTSTTAAPLPDL